MYAVGKLSSYISRGAYTVSGPFHPFGGAVDIIVVQQKDGSFKSSPWYVRFGKFQGVLKAREKVVRICVNGVEAGFSMYLDSKGEAFFLRDAEDAERHFIPSLPTSGDGTYAMTKNGLNKAQSLKAESSWKEPVAQPEVGNDRIAQTNSRKSKMLGRMFGGKLSMENSASGHSRKSVKEDPVNGSSGKSMEDSVSGPMKRVSSFERAEIAADLLEVKWSTNLTFSERERGEKSKEKLSESFETNPSSVNPEQISQSPTLPDDFRKDEVLESHVKSNLGTEFSEKARDNCSARARVDANVVEGCTFGAYNYEISSKLSSDQVSLDANSIAQVSNLNTTNTSNDPERQCDICLNLMVAEEHFQERSFHDNLAVKSELAYVLAAKRTEADSAFSSVNTAQPVDGIHGKRSVVSRENDLKYYSQSIESSFSTSDLPNNEDAKSRFGTTSSKSIGCQRETTSELGSPSGLGGLACQANANSCNKDTWEKSRDDDYSVSRTLQSGNLSISFDGSAANSLNHKLHPYKIQSDSLMEESSLERGENLEETVESCVSTFESFDDTQFPLIEDESLGADGSGCRLQNNDTFMETKVQILKAEHDMEEYETKVLDDEEDASDALMSYTIPIDISACKKVSDGNKLAARSLPILFSPFSQFEDPYFHHHLSSSLDAKSHIYEMNMFEGEGTSSLKQELELEINQDPGKLAFYATYTNIYAESSGEKNSTSSNPTTELSLSKHLLAKGMGAEAARQAFDSEKEHIFKPQGRIPVEGEGKNAKMGPRGNSSPEGSWRLWPFGLRRTRTLDNVQPPKENVTKKDKSGNSNRESSVPRTNIRRKVKLLTPATEELASLKLKEGRNMVTFTFSTPLLGLQQVDARIYLWKWNTQIVISDVDGTITKSDVLGQFMPLVGMDWSQTGVTHLYSAIKENGYQFLFLSARAISQAHVTRQFLVNLKQNGKILPDGPVVISPDGLFPSLYREVIRRAPHEFKISCLEAIKAIFPHGYNPFYAGFGNRDTDEISYLKVGIPLGKIFIINPRGEVVINRQIDTKSYNKLHELVNAIFPPRTSDEQAT